MRGVGWLLAGLFCLGIGLAASAQNVPEPLRGDYRLTVAEPAEGATVTSTTVRVRIAVEPRAAAATPPAKNATATPPPPVDVYLDRAPRGTLKPGETTMLLTDVPAGTHTLLAAADDGSGNVVDRVEVHFTVLPPAPD